MSISRQLAGGVDSGPSPLDYLFISLAGCIVTIGHIIAKQRHLPVRKIEVRVEGTNWTQMFSWGSTRMYVPVFLPFRVHVNIDADMSQEAKEQFLHDIDARCPISDNHSQVRHRSNFVVDPVCSR
jgi:putative redox protein